MAIVTSRRSERKAIKADRPIGAAKSMTIDLAADLTAVENAYVSVGGLGVTMIDTVIPLLDANYPDVGVVGTAFPPFYYGASNPPSISGGHVEIRGLNYNLGTAAVPADVAGVVFDLVLLWGPLATVGAPGSINYQPGLDVATALATRRARGQVVWEIRLPVGAFFDRELPKIVLNYIPGQAEEARVRLYLAAPAVPPAANCPITRNVTYLNCGYRNVTYTREDGLPTYP